MVNIAKDQDTKFKIVLQKLDISKETAFERIREVTVVESNIANRDVERVAKEFGVSFSEAFDLYLAYIKEYIKAKNFISTIN